MLNHIAINLDQNSTYKTFPTRIYRMTKADSSNVTPKPKIVYLAALFLWAFTINLLFFFKILK